MNPVLKNGIAGEASSSGAMPFSSSRMKILMISSDRKVFEQGSAVAERMKLYASLVEELHIVVLSDSSHGLKDAKLANNLWAYPTNSSFKLMRPFDATSLGKKLVKEKGFVRGRSVITAQDPFECGWAGVEVKKKWRLPLEVQIHTDPFSPFFNSLPNSVRKIIAKKVLARADRIRAVSREVSQKLSTDGSLAGKIYVAPIAVDMEKVTGGALTFDAHARFGWRNILLSVARLEKEKNLPFALRALALVRQRYPDTGLVIVGSGSQESALKSLAQKLQLGGFVEFAGWQKELSSFYKSADLFIQTSRFEGYGLALVEAGLNNLAVISTSVGIVSELTNGKELYVVEHDDDQSLAAAICDLLENNFKRENMRLNMKNTLEEKLISPEKAAQEIARNWEKVASFVG